MGYDIFSQPTGPVVPVTLFSDAATAGISAGNAQKTWIQSAVEGVTQGIQNGQTIVANNQNAEIRQNRIDQQPVQNARDLEALEKERQANEIEALRLERDKQLQDYAINAGKAKYESEASEYKQKNDDYKTANEIIDIAKSGTDADKQGLITDSAKRQYLLAHPELAGSVFGSIAGSLDQASQNEATKIIEFGKQLQVKSQFDKANYKTSDQALSDRNKAEGELSPFKFWTTDSPNLADGLKQLKVVPTGSLIKNAEGSLIDSYAPIQIDKTSTYDVVKNGRIVGSVDPKTAEKYQDWVRANTDYENAVKRGVGGLLNVGSLSGTPAATPNPQVTHPPPSQQERQPAPVPGGGPTQSQGVDQNQNIVDQKKEEFNAISKTNPGGFSASGIDARLMEKKAQIQKSYNPPPPLKTVSPLPEGTQMPHPPVTDTPANILSNGLKQDVSFNFNPPVIKQLSNGSVQTVSTNKYLSDETPLIKGLALIESGGKENALSNTNVQGLLQVTRATAKAWGLNASIPEENVLAGKLTLAQNLKMFDGNTPLALAAYNAGPGVIRDAVKAAGSTDWQSVKVQLKNLLSTQKYNEVSSYPEKVMTASIYFTGVDAGQDKQLYSTFINSGVIKANPLGLGGA